MVWVGSGDELVSKWSLAEVIIINTTTYHPNLCECSTKPSTEKLLPRIQQISFVSTRVSNKIIPYLCIKIFDCRSCRLSILIPIYLGMGTLQITGSPGIQFKKVTDWVHFFLYILYNTKIKKNIGIIYFALKLYRC